MTGGERDLQVEVRADQILEDDRVLATYTRFVDAQLRWHRIRNLLGRLCGQ